MGPSYTVCENLRDLTTGSSPRDLTVLTTSARGRRQTLTFLSPEFSGWSETL